MVIFISIYSFMPTTRVSVVAEAIREITNQVGMALRIPAASLILALLFDTRSHM